MQKYRIVHFPQIPGPSFEFPVATPVEGAKFADVLADYDLFQFENNIKPDYANLTMLQEWNEEEGEWFDWYREEDGAELDDLIADIRT